MISRLSFIGLLCILLFSLQSKSQTYRQQNLSGYDSSAYMRLKEEAENDSEQNEKTADNVSSEDLIEANDEAGAKEKYEEDAEDEDADNGYVQRKIGDDKWKKIKEDKNFIYSYQKEKTAPKALPEKKYKPSAFINFLNGQVFEIILYILVISLLIFILYRIFENSSFNYFRFSSKKSTEEDNLESGTKTNILFDEEIKKAIQNQDFRLAVNLLYRKTIYLLDQKNQVVYEEDKSNWAYVQELIGKPTERTFSTLTRYFDYIWYGSYPLNHGEFKNIHDQFKQFETDLA